MEIQRKDYWCGPASIVNALKVFGMMKNQGTVAKVCAVTHADGTDETEVKRALLSLGFQVDEWEYPKGFESERWLRSHLTTTGPVILCLDEWEHWCTAIGICNDRYLIWDPALGAGFRSYNWRGLRTRWQLPRREGGPSYYGVGVSK